MDKELIKYFMDETNKRFDKLDGKVDQLLRFKWQAVGMMTVFLFCLNFGMRYASKL